jgi:hypothetical protein
LSFLPSEKARSNGIALNNVVKKRGTVTADDHHVDTALHAHGCGTQLREHAARAEARELTETGRAVLDIFPPERREALLAISDYLLNRDY